jgi:hypothetical protein
MSMTLNANDFLSGIKKLAEESTPKEIDKALFKASSELLRDAIEINPQAPIYAGDKGGGGDLRASAHVQGSGGLVKPNPASAPMGFESVRESYSSMAITAGFNIKYAARWHEINAQDLPFLRDKLGRAYSHHWPIKWTWPGVGPKYLESKMASNPKKYAKIIALHLARFLMKSESIPSGEGK